jgi:Protein of unknown function (DUF2695)
VDKAQKKELKRRARARLAADAEEEWSRLGLAPEELKALLDDVDAYLGAQPCDHTPRRTRQWAIERGFDADELSDALAEFGGGCDCEVLANVDPLTQVHGWPSYVARFGPG